jgi:hypothetical protein
MGRSTLVLTLLSGLAALAASALAAVMKDFCDAARQKAAAALCNLQMDPDVLRDAGSGLLLWDF